MPSSNYLIYMGAGTIEQFVDVAHLPCEPVKEIIVLDSLAEALGITGAGLAFDQARGLPGSVTVTHG